MIVLKLFEPNVRYLVGNGRERGPKFLNLFENNFKKGEKGLYLLTFLFEIKLGVGLKLR